MCIATEITVYEIKCKCRSHASTFNICSVSNLKNEIDTLRIKNVSVTAEQVTVEIL